MVSRLEAASRLGALAEISQLCFKSFKDTQRLHRCLVGSLPLACESCGASCALTGSRCVKGNCEVLGEPATALLDLPAPCTAGESAGGTWCTRVATPGLLGNPTGCPAMLDLRFVPKLLLQHDSSPETILEDVHAAFLQAVKQRAVHASVSPSG